MHKSFYIYTLHSYTLCEKKNMITKHITTSYLIAVCYIAIVIYCDTIQVYELYIWIAM